MNDRSMISDDWAVDSIPVALAGTTVLIAIIVALAAFGVKNTMPAVELASVDRQAGEVANVCRYLLSLAPRHLDDPGSPPGALRFVRFDLPEGTEYLSFGDDPDSGRRGHGGTIYYKVGGSKKALVVDERAIFLQEGGGTALLRSGRHDLQIEYACDALGRRYLLVSGA